ncbi:MAG: hypothetical protein KF752_05495 [Pirellulaceae bacterium]|nr:hypothetical protein [Pirellulaceae bacterium]
MLTGVSLTCFLFSYLAVLGLELARLFFRIPWRQALAVFGMSAGVLAHTIFLVNQLLQPDSGRLLSDWFQWCVLAAWGLAAVCTLLMARNPNGHLGLFLIPTVLALIGLASVAQGGQSFAETSEISFWGRTHGVSLLLGTMFIGQGFAFGLMYLVQSHRLKTKRNTSGSLRLPALEFLRSMNRLSIYAATLALAVGMVSGILLNVNRDQQMAWYSGSVLVSLALFVWVAITALLEYGSKGSLGGRRSAYLSIANFLFLAIVLLLVLRAAHGERATPVTDPESALSVDSATPAVARKAER